MLRGEDEEVRRDDQVRGGSGGQVPMQLTSGAVYSGLLYPNFIMCS